MIKILITLNNTLNYQTNGLVDYRANGSDIFVTKIKTRNRIIGCRFQKTRIRITVIKKNENEIKTKISTNKTNENENFCSKKRKMLANNVIFISLPKNATTS